MGAKGWIIFSAVAVLLLGGLVYVSGQNRLDVSEFDQASIIDANEKNGSIGDRVFGNREAKTILIEYGDFQCPGCASAHPTVKTLTEKYKDDIAFVFRNLPLTQIHPNARAAAATAEAAGKQGKYWETHNKLFENQKEWSSASSSDRGSIFEGYARTLQLNLDTFNTDIAGPEVSKKIAFDTALARAAGFNSTPTFLLNGKVIDQDVWGDKTKLEQAIKDSIGKADVTPAKTSKE